MNPQNRGERMNILVTGGTGFIGRHVIQHLLGRGDEVSVLTRDRRRAEALFQGRVHAVESLNELSAARAPEAVINLAGQNLGSGRWNAALKEAFIDSRVNTTRQVVNYIARLPVKPRVLVSGSAVGYYGARGDTPLEEDVPPGDEYQSHLCEAWEHAAMAAERHGVRVCLSRTGVVLGSGGGALSSLVPPFRRGLGAYLGNGRQWMPWIHMDDVVAVFMRLIADDSLSGPFNVTAPQPQTNRDFARTLGRVLQRPVLLRIPGWAVRLMVGEMARLYLTGQKVVPRRLLEAGYDFKYPQLDMALRAVLSQSD